MIGHIELLGVKIHNLTTEEALRVSQEFIFSGRGHIICTPNVDDIIKARKDAEFRAIMNSADLSIPDGMGVICASRLLGKPLKGNVAGRLFLLKFCQLAAKEGYSIYFLGAAPGVALKAAKFLMQRYRGLRVAGTYSPSYGFLIGEKEDRRVVKSIKTAKPQALFVAFGSPRQEKWIKSHLEELQVPVCIGVGCAFDVIAGKVKESPKWMTRVGLEWLFRFTQEPKRLWRRYLIDDPCFFYLIAKAALLRQRKEWHRNCSS